MWSSEPVGLGEWWTSTHSRQTRLRGPSDAEPSYSTPEVLWSKCDGSEPPARSRSWST
jgi:hypothetical protein